MTSLHPTSRHTGRVDPDVADLFDNVFADWHSRRPAPGVVLELDRDLWARLDELGLTDLASADGADVWTVAELLRAAARYAVPLPIAEHDALAGLLATRAGLSCGSGIRTIARLDVYGTDRAVPWASQVDRILVLRPSGDAAFDAWQIADIPVSSCRLESATDLAGRPRDRLTMTASAGVGTLIGADLAREFFLRAALMRAVQATGALDRIIDLCVRHVTERRQFGRPLARFQAVQHLVADAAAESALAHIATDAALTSLASLGRSGASLDELERAVAIARSVLGTASGVVVGNAHQVHGAIGTTLEHPLRGLTQPVLSWRNDYGTTRDWDLRVCQLVPGEGDGAWAALVGK
jgi:acyl-CoA dehydrogenase